MIKVEDSIAYIEGDAKTLCIQFTHLVVLLINTLQKDFSLSQEDCIKIINECAKIAYMDDEARAEMLERLEKNS